MLETAANSNRDIVAYFETSDGREIEFTSNDFFEKFSCSYSNDIKYNDLGFSLNEILLPEKTFREISFQDEFPLLPSLMKNSQQYMLDKVRERQLAPLTESFTYYNAKSMGVGVKARNIKYATKGLC